MLSYNSGDLCFKQGSELVKLSQFTGKTGYVYDLDGIVNRFNLFKKHIDADIHYAMKANSNKIIMKALAKAGSGVDTVSGGEIRLALDSGFKASSIVFSGVGKSVSEIELAISNNIKQINVESPQELIRIGELGKKAKKSVNVAFRMNPDVDAKTHPYIKTGFRENKFGMDNSFIYELSHILVKYKNVLNLKGLTLHIGSQLQEIDSIADAIQKTKDIYLDFQKKGYKLETFDIGGGLGIDYRSGDFATEEKLIQDYGKKVKQLFSNLPCRVLCEPGRIIVGRFGVLLTEVQYIKETPYKKFVIVDTGMHHLMRPSLYQAFHRILPLKEGEIKNTFDVVGPICESSDVIGHDRQLPEIKQGDWLAIADTGAYGFVMASHYNHHDLPQEIVVSGGKIL